MDYSGILKNLYPEGSYQGQCAVFTEKITDMPHVGNFKWTKYAAIALYGISKSRMGALQVGDVVITSDGDVGHTCFVNSKPAPTTSQLSESNWNLDGRVHHTRIIPDSYPFIIGVFRNRKLLFPIPVPPAPAYNIPMKIKFITNNAPEWASLRLHLENATNWLYRYSGARILPVFDPITTNFQNIPCKVSPGQYGDYTVKITDENWYNQNLLPLAQGFDAVIFLMPKKDFTDTVIDHPELMELGYCYEYSANYTRPKLPIKIIIALDEGDDYSPYYPSIGGLAKYIVHELGHGLQGIAANNLVVPGGDYTHNLFYGLNGYPMQPELLYSKYMDYDKLSLLIPK